MTTPSIEKLKLHNKNIMNRIVSLDLKKRGHYLDIIEKYFLAKGWLDALNYITKNYKLEEK